MSVPEMNAYDLDSDFDTLPDGFITQREALRRLGIHPTQMVRTLRDGGRFPVPVYSRPSLVRSADVDNFLALRATK